jgi:hypothetical protein
MSKLMRFAVLVVSLLSLFGVLSSAAGAVTWTNTGDTAFTATGGPMTFSGGGLSWICTGSDWSGTTGSSPFVGAIYRAVTGHGDYTGCSIASVSTAVTCDYTLTATSWAAGPPAVTSGNVDLTCNVTQGGTKICHIEGQTASHYVNPTATAFGKFVMTESSTLKMTNAVGSCPFGNNVTETLSMHTWTITNATGGPAAHTGPIITRHP